MLSIGVIAAGVALALGLGFFVATGVARATRKVREVTEALANGDLTRSSGLTPRTRWARWAPRSTPR